ncbi:glycosyltransferase family 4 protein [Malikia sp.]|uniref:glycosyltransferase family 4 protein n=1 Tax=Malikia sp. TaxID=2070706 RepID=UPI0026093F83|nr:glycosyltransferase family 4 protein [Malikia sp.]MDD2728281.1 glycosyltransferase family 4 protein [Malikia sp.]
MGSHRHASELARRFAWLLRSDLRAAYPDPDGAGFADWWLIKGRLDYPAWADQLSVEQIQRVFGSEGRVEIAGLGLELPRCVGLLAKQRPDAVRELSESSEPASERFIAWALLQGLVEHGLAEHAPRGLVAALDQPLPVADRGADAPPAATLLMHLLRSLLDADTQRRRDLHSSDGRRAFLAWFFSVVGTLGIAPLVAARWRAWLQMPAPELVGEPEIPRFAHLVWQASAELQAQYPLAQAAGRQGLKTWADQARERGGWEWLRGHAASVQSAVIEPADTQAWRSRPFGVNLYGFAYGELGIGEDLRMAVECCKAADIPYRVINIDAGADLRQADDVLKRDVEAAAEQAPYAINLFCLPGFDTVSRVFLRQGHLPFEGHYNIGWWPWELPVWPAAWRDALDLMDELWASSEFTAQAYRQATQKPVHLVPLAVSVERGARRPRKFFGLPDDKFLFLFVFDFNSHLARKNPQAVVEAFRQAFPASDDSVRLVLKVMNDRERDPRWIEFMRLCEQDKRILLLRKTLDRPDVLGLIEACDAYVSLHRAEGFGRTLAEAMLYGKPVIATNYSGNADFMHPECSLPVTYRLAPLKAGDYHFIDSGDAASWADVDIDDAARQMRRAQAMTVDATWSRKVKVKARRQFGIERVAATLVNRLHEIS